MEGFNITYKELNEQQENEINKRSELEAQIALEEAAIEQEKVGFIEKERSLQSMQQEFNMLLQDLRSRENERNLASQKLHFLKDKESGLKDFLNKAESQLRGIQDSIEFSQLQVGEEESKLGEGSVRERKVNT